MSNCEEFSSLSKGIQHLTTLEEFEIDRCPKLNISNLFNSRTCVIMKCWWGCLRSSNMSLHYNICWELCSAEIIALTSLPQWLSLELARRLEKEKGEDWYKTAHVPEVYVHSNVDVPPAKPKVLSCLRGGSMMAACSVVVAASVRMHY